MSTPVDFDYNGPPVNVTNGMAVQLVEEFGIKNAWFAFLKLRGMKLKNEEAENANESFVYFRNKIGHLRRLIKENKKQKEKNNEEIAATGSLLDDLSSADFDNFFVSPDSIELRKDVTKYPDVEDNEFLKDFIASSSSSTGEITSSPTTASLLQVIEQSKKRQQKIDKNVDNIDNKLTRENNDQQKNLINNNKTDEPSSLISEEQKEENNSGVSIQGKNLQNNTKYLRNNNNKSTTTDNIETKQMVEKLLAAKEEIARRHAETIDDVVSVVMEKIRNNQPFEGELTTSQSGHFIPPKSHHKRTTGIVGSSSGGQKLSQQQRAGGIHVMGQGQQLRSNETILRQQHKGSVLTSVSSEGVLTTATPTTAFSHFSPGQSIVLLQNPVPSSGSIQIPQSQISFGGLPLGSPTSSTHKSRQNTYNNGQMMETAAIQHSQQTVQSIGSSVSSSIQGTTVPRLQQHVYTIGQPFIAEDPALGGGTTSTAIPLEMAIQQNMTVQELIQTLKVQGNRHPNTQIILQTNATNLPSTPTAVPFASATIASTIQNQQETPDSSSQEASIQENALKSMYPKKEKNDNLLKKGRKKKKVTIFENEKQLENVSKTNIEKIDTEANIQEKNKMVPQVKDNEIKSPLPEASTKGKKQTNLNVSSITPSSTNQKQQQRIDDLENQLKKLNKQLIAERNKSATQKKRADKALTDLEKASDSIQLLKIDLACQKTDNNTLIAENISLKAENQQLRSKEKRIVSGSSTTATSIIASKNSRKRKETSDPDVLIKNEKNSSNSSSGGRSRKTTTKTSDSGLPEKTSTPPPLSSELGRRQSKRICVSRNQFMRNFF